MLDKNEIKTALKQETECKMKELLLPKNVAVIEAAEGVLCGVMDDLMDAATEELGLKCDEEVLEKLAATISECMNQAWEEL